MQRFRFTLQALLTVRQRQEQVALERYAEALHAQQRALAILTRADAALASAATALGGRLTLGVPAGELAQRGEHLRQLSLERSNAERAAAAAQRAVEPALNEVIEVRRQREIVEECRSQQLQRHQREAARQETRQLDELAIQRYSPPGRRREQEEMT